MCCGGPLRHVSAYLAETVARHFVLGLDLSHFHPKEFVGFRTQINSGIGMSVLLSPFPHDLEPCLSSVL